jgi:hypothetical protein
MSLDRSRVDDTEFGDLPVKAVSERFPVAAGGFHAGVDGKIRTGVGDEPLVQFGMAFGGVGKLASRDDLACLDALDGNVVVGLGDVDP